MASSTDTEGSSLTADSIEAPVADAMHRQKGIWYQEEVNILPMLSSKLDSIVTASIGQKTGWGPHPSHEHP